MGKESNREEHLMEKQYPNVYVKDDMIVVLDGDGEERAIAERISIKSPGKWWRPVRYIWTLSTCTEASPGSLRCHGAI